MLKLSNIAHNHQHLLRSRFRYCTCY